MLLQKEKGFGNVSKDEVKTAHTDSRPTARLHNKLREELATTDLSICTF
jgi:hypothetical protein